MEEILGIIWALLNWRLLLSIVSPLLVALGLSKVFVWFNPGIGLWLNLFLLGTCFGIFWQTRSEYGIKLTDSVPATKISKPIEFLGFAVVGGLLGAVESSIFDSAIFGALALFVTVALVTLWYRYALHQKISQNHLIFVTASLLIGFSVLLMLKLLLA